MPALLLASSMRTLFISAWKRGAGDEEKKAESLGARSSSTPARLLDLIAHLFGDAVDLPVLFVDLVAHVHGHGLQVADDVAHGAQVLLHLILAGVVGYPAARMGCCYFEGALHRRSTGDSNPGPTS